MQSFESASIAQDYGEPLLYIICALGARYAILWLLVSPVHETREKCNLTLYIYIWTLGTFTLMQY